MAISREITTETTQKFGPAHLSGNSSWSGAGHHRSSSDQHRPMVRSNNIPGSKKNTGMPATVTIAGSPGTSTSTTWLMSMLCLSGGPPSDVGRS